MAKTKANENIKNLQSDHNSLQANFNALQNAIPPVGSIIAYHPGHYGDSNNGSFTLRGPANNNVNDINNHLPGNWRVCDGSQLNDSSSPIFNGPGRYLPQLTNQRFIRGNTQVGGAGGNPNYTPSGSLSLNSTFSGTAVARSSWFTTSYTPGGSIGGSQNISHSHYYQHDHDVGAARADISIHNDAIYAYLTSSPGAEAKNNVIRDTDLDNVSPSNSGFQTKLWGPTTMRSDNVNTANITVSGSNFSFSGTNINPQTALAASGNYTPSGSVTTTGTFTGNASTIEPNYVNVVYIMRIK